MKSIINGLRGWIRGISEIERFRKELKAYHAIEHVFLVSSGKAALYLILKALKSLQPDRDEVVVPAFTCYSVPSAIMRAGLRVRLCDIDPETLDFDYTLLEEIIKSDTSERILSLIPTHLFGLPSDVARVRRLITGTGIKLVEDAAQSMGAKVKGQFLGTLGDVGFFSLGRGKAFSTVEGGIVLTSNTHIATALKEELSQFREYRVPEIIGLALQSIILSIFMDPRFFWFPKSLPFLNLGETHFERHFPLKKLSAFQAGVSREWQDSLEKISSIRKRNSAGWTEELKRSEFLNQFKVIETAIPLLRYPLLVRQSDQRWALLKASEARGLGVMQAYPESLDRLDELAQKDHCACCLNAHAVAQQMITLPVHGYVSRMDCQKFRELFALVET
ncbi:DegT/DnrJ/EryC1/StrS family aminotransferase [Desulfoluna sp.]|uniref:DegT/DnrJ/EryC1/StrS family aminotransferase n=1 Tax=Desulfoluna sp. TaxID=2045199 RepID=UPI00262DDADF|nr:DegT/DnrJ/EryC1/StrS family aminotransferase [Desulfoluna sp.]